MDEVKGSDYEPDKCRDCRFFVAAPEGTVGKCHRFPAQTTIVLIPDGVDMIRQVPKLKTIELNAFPNIEADQWCGEWKKNET